MTSLTSSLTIKLIDDVSKPARTVAEALKQAEAQAKSVAKAMSGTGATDRLTGQLAKMKLGARDIETVAKAWQDYARSAKLAGNASEWTRADIAGVRRWESQTITALRAVQREQAKFDRASRGRGHGGEGGGHGGGGMWGHTGALGFAAQGAAAAVSAHAVYDVNKEAILAGAELQHERVSSMNAGRTAGELRAFEDAAKKVALARPTASYTESMKTLLETTSAFGSTEHAIEHLDFMMKTASVLKSASGGKIEESAGEMGQKFAKFFEMRGVAGDPRRFEAEGNEIVRAMAFTGGTFNPREMFNFASQAKSALRNYDPTYLSRVVPSLVGETGGERAGTAANAFYNVIMGKARDAKQASEWMKYGLLDPKMVDMKKGQAMSWRAGAVKGTDIALRNPLEWFESTVLPAMRAKGVKVDDTMELSKVLATMFRNSMSNQFANENAQLADRTRLHKDAGLIDKTAAPDEMYARNLAMDPTQAVTALTASLNSLAAAATQPGMQAAAGAISSIAGGLMTLAAAAKDHPMLALGAAGATSAAAFGGAGYLSYQFLNGFGLASSATALDGSAAALTAAAGRLGVGGTVTAAETAGGGAAATGLAAGSLRALLGAAGLGGLLGGTLAFGQSQSDAEMRKRFPSAGPGQPNALGAYDRLIRGRDGNLRPLYGPPAPQRPPVGWWEWLKSSIIPAAHAEPGPGPRGDPAGGARLGGIQQQADAAKAALDSVSATTVAPQVDTSGLAGAEAAAKSLLATLMSIQGAAKGAAASAAAIKVPSIGAANRGSFQASGDPGR